jgi:hypothetical protein
MWPIMAINNNLPPQERYKESNIVLLGMWIHESLHPPPTLMKLFVNECISNYRQGLFDDQIFDEYYRNSCALH